MFPWLKKLLKKSSDPDTCAAMTPEEDMTIAQAAMAEGDLKHSAFHVGAALVVDPNRAEWLEFLNRLITIAPDPLALAPLDANNYVGTVAVRAYILAHLGRFNGPDDALSLLAQAALAKPDSAFLEWLIGWLDDPQNVGKLDLKYLASLTGGGNVEEKDDRFAKLFHDPASAPFVSRLGRVATAAVKHQTDQNPFSMMLVRILRLNGFLDDALAVAKAVYEHAPGYFSAVSLATTYRECGELDTALALYEKAHQWEPTETGILLDLGDLNYQIGGFDAATHWYEAVLAREPEQTWATASLLGIRVLQAKSGDETAATREAIEAYYEANKDSPRVLWLMRGLYIPYFDTYLPEPGEATINGFKGFSEAADRGEDVAGSEDIRMGLSQLECPSAIASVRTAMKARFGIGLEVSVSHMPTPDPRNPTRDTGFTLWKYDGTDAMPGVPEAHTPAVDAAIRAIAGSPYLFSAWVYKAHHQAKELGADTVPALLWAMVAPPEKSDAGIPQWSWMFRVQIAVALLLAFRENGWQGTRRRTGLLALLHGPMDWSVSAAIIALVAVAQAERNEAVTREIRAEFQQMRRFIPKDGQCCWHPVLLLGMMQLPGIGQEEAGALWNEYKELSS